MTADLIYPLLKKDITRSYTSGDLDNSHDQMKLSLGALDRLYNHDRFQSIETFEQDKHDLLEEIQDSVDDEIGRKVFTDLLE